MSTSRSVRSKSIGHYVLMKTIGEGTFGKVKLGAHILTGERVAVKVLEKERIVDIADVERVAREIHILKLIRHPHIIQLYEIIETPRQLYLIMEYACGGELFDYIVQHGRAEEPEACRFLHQILAGVERVHEMCVVHRDLKPENLLLDDRKDIKIVDFGLSNTYKEGDLLQTACGSPCYAAPEMISGHRYKPCMVDIWSCGVILFALVCGCLPFESNEEDQNHTELYRKILDAEYEVPEEISREVADLIKGMLTTDPEKRLTLAGIRQHPWYRQIPEASIRHVEDQGVLDEDILEQLNSYGFPREYAKKCLETNKHNHVTTTYYLLKEKRHLAKAATVGATATELAIAALDATGRGEEVPMLAAALPGPRGDTAAAVAAVATPSRGQRLEAEPGPLLAAFSAFARPPPQRWGEGDRIEAVRQPPQDVPRLNLGTVTGSGQVRGASHPPRAGSPQSARGAPVTPRGGPVARPMSARGYAPTTSCGSRRHPAHADYARGSYSADWAPWSSRPASREPVDFSAPLTARPRLQGHSPGPSGYTARPHGGWGAGAPGPVRAGRHHGALPLSARGRRDVEDPRLLPQGGACQVSCHSSLSPQRTLAEVLSALASNHIAFRHTSSFGVRCQAGNVQFEAEVLQVSRGGRFMLRFSRTAGEVGQYKDICDRLLAEMSL